MAAAAILKIRKIAISPQWNDDCDEIWHSYVSGPSRHRQPIKFQHRTYSAKIYPEEFVIELYANPMNFRRVIENSRPEWLVVWQSKAIVDIRLRPDAQPMIGTYTSHFGCCAVLSRLGIQYT